MDKFQGQRGKVPGDMIHAPNMLLIGAADRNVGKTTFACEVISRFVDTPVSAAKVTAIQERNGLCPQRRQRMRGLHFP